MQCTRKGFLAMLAALPFMPKTAAKPAAVERTYAAAENFVSCDTVPSGGYAWERLTWDVGTRPWRSDPVKFWSEEITGLSPESQAELAKTLDEAADRNEAKT